MATRERLQGLSRERLQFLISYIHGRVVVTYRMVEEHTAKEGVILLMVRRALQEKEQKKGQEKGVGTVACTKNKYLIKRKEKNYPSPLAKGEGRVILEDNLIELHPNSPEERILKEYQEKVNKILKLN